MHVAALIDHLAQDGPELLASATRAGWNAPVPCTDWTVRDLVIHTGGVHRWAADVVRTRPSSLDTPSGRAVGTGPGDDELAAWFSEGHAALVNTLQDAPDDLECPTFLPADSPKHFWARRQAHETAVHRADAQAAAGEAASFDAAFAQDGIAELVLGFARRRSNTAPRRVVLGLDAADGPSWLINLGGERNEARETEDLTGTDLTVRGLSADLYLWLWNRQAAVALDGDPDAAQLWASTVRVRWS